MARKNKWIVFIYYHTKLFIVSFLPFKIFKIFKTRVPLKILFNPHKTRLLGQVAPYSLCGYPRLSNVYDLARKIEKERIEGDFVECGTWKGGTTAIMGALARGERKTWYFDSFEGLPESKEAEKGKFIASENDVRELIHKLNLLKDKNIIVKGWFKDTLPKAPIDKIAILRMDADIYQSTKEILESLYHKVVVGGYVIIDDYGGWEGCRRAVDEFFGSSKLDFQLIGTYDPRKGAPVYFKKM